MSEAQAGVLRHVISFKTYIHRKVNFTEIFWMCWKMGQNSHSETFSKERTCLPKQKVKHTTPCVSKSLLPPSIPSSTSEGSGRDSTEPTLPGVGYWTYSQPSWNDFRKARVHTCLSSETFSAFPFLLIEMHELLFPHQHHHPIPHTKLYKLNTIWCNPRLSKKKKKTAKQLAREFSLQNQWSFVFLCLKLLDSSHTHWIGEKKKR